MSSRDRVKINCRTIYRALQVSGPYVGSCKLIEKDVPAQLGEGEVLIQSQFSSINFKDALAVTGKGKILKNYPLTPGIDVAGTIVASRSKLWHVGQEVLLTGCGLGEHIDGGFSEMVRAPEAELIALPEGLSSRDAMALGTAGFTAALCVHRMLVNGQEKSKGPILVSGASGGVGMISIDLLTGLGFEVWAVSGKANCKKLLLELGAKRVILPEELELGQRALESVRFGGAIDNVGGTFLEGALRHVQLWGNIASVGMASGATFSATVMPHILRGVSLLGISSANCPLNLRRDLWLKLAGEWKSNRLSQIVSRTVELGEVDLVCDDMLSRKTFGRTLVKFSN